jgi:hypothetical protein
MTFSGSEGAQATSKRIQRYGGRNIHPSGMPTCLQPSQHKSRTAGSWLLILADFRPMVQCMEPLRLLNKCCCIKQKKPLGRPSNGKDQSSAKTTPSYRRQKLGAAGFPHID